MGNDEKDHRGKNGHKALMNARKYLSQVKLMEWKIQKKQRELEDAKILAYGNGSPANYNERVQTSRDLHRMEKQVANITDLEAEINKDIEKYLWTKDEVINTIFDVSNSKQIMVLYARYVDGDRLEDIAHYRNYNFNYVQRIHWKGVKEVERILEERNT